MTNFPNEKDRRRQNRRTSDRIIDDLYKNMSTPNCHSCLENQGEAILLLNYKKECLYATTPMRTIAQNCNDLFTLEPQFSLHDQQKNSLLVAYFNDHENKHSYVLNLSSNKKQILLFCTRLPGSNFREQLSIAHFIIKLRNAAQFSNQQWHYFGVQFSLTPAEIRLCQALMEGLSLDKIAVVFNISITTVRSQLSAVFSKTFTRRQTDLLRLIFLMMNS